MSPRVTAIALCVWLAACQSAGPPASPTPDERFSYALGAKLGSDLRKSQNTLDRDEVLRGVEDGLADRVALSDAELAAALRAGFESRRAAQAAQRDERAAAADEAGRAFLAANATRPGVVTLANGLQYEVLENGRGESPAIEDFVTCHYRGSLVDGTVFDDTAALGRARTFAVTSVVDGLEQALLRMQPGARWKVFVPPALGYGAASPSAKIPPNATLVFEIELVEIAKRPSP